MSKAKKLIEEHIVKRSNELPADLRKQFRPEQNIEMELTGPEGCILNLAWDNGVLSMKEGKAKSAMVRTSTSVRGFLDLMTGKYCELLDITKPGATNGLMMDPIQFMQPSKLEVVQKITGTLVIQYCDGSAPNDDILSETFVAFNNEPIDREEPRCTVIMPIGKLERIAKGEVTPPQLMMAGGMRVIGDMQMVIKMSPLLR